MPDLQLYLVTCNNNADDDHGDDDDDDNDNDDDDDDDDRTCLVLRSTAQWRQMLTDFYSAILSRRGGALSHSHG